jgi:1-deoxy-D-xylulose-5-phosphate synthase
VLVRNGAQDVLIVGIGSMAATSVEVAERLVAQGIGVTVVDPRWVKPLPVEITELAAVHGLVVTVEDNGRVGGCGSVVCQAVLDAGLSVPVRVFGLPQRFLDQGKRATVLSELGLDAPALAREITAHIAGLHGADDATTSDTTVDSA